MGARLCLALSPLCPQIPEACVSGDLAVGGVQNDWLVPAGKPLLPLSSGKPGKLFLKIKILFIY